MKQILPLLICIPAATTIMAQKQAKSIDMELLTALLGEMPQKNPLQTDTLETTRLDGGTRYKIRYFIEAGNPRLDTPDDWGYAYLFIPELKKGQKAPAIVALHQDDVNFHIGKAEPAGLMGDSTVRNYSSGDI